MYNDLTMKEVENWFVDGYPERVGCIDLYALHADPSQLKHVKRNSIADGLWYAHYLDEDYSGSAFVLYEKDGKLFEVNGGHCSCYGLEGQWEPEEVTVEALQHRFDKGHLKAWPGLEQVLKRLKDRFARNAV